MSGFWKPWSKQDDERVITDAKANVSPHVTAAALGRTAKAVGLRRVHLRSRGVDVPFVRTGRAPGKQKQPAVRAAGRTERKCLNCSNPFMSEGAHNRLCNRCRYSASTASPYAP